MNNTNLYIIRVNKLNLKIYIIFVLFYSLLFKIDFF